MSKPYRCPICGGNGLVPNGFYSQTTGMWGSTSTAPESCRTCNGSGIVWKISEEPTTEEYEAFKKQNQ